jgi:hypothetical protein
MTKNSRNTHEHCPICGGSGSHGGIPCSYFGNAARVPDTEDTYSPQGQVVGYRREGQPIRDCSLRAERKRDYERRKRIRKAARL